MDKKYWTSDRIISTCAILISLMTLCVLIIQTKIIHEQQKNSVLPYLELSNYNTGGPNFSYVLSNEGVGPAFIESIKIFHQDSIYETDLPVFLYQNFPESDSINNLYHSNIAPGRLLPAGERIKILEIRNSLPDAMRLISLLQKLDSTRMEITYRSIYDEKWMVGSETPTPIKLD